MAIQIPIGQEGEHRGVVNLVSMTATTYAAGSTAGDDRADPGRAGRARPQAAREALIDVVAENDDALIEKYLEGEEITTEELIGGILAGVAEGRISPGGLRGRGDRAPAWTGCSTCSSRRCPSPVDVGAWPALDPDRASRSTVTLSEDGPAIAYCFKTAGRPVQRPHQPAARLLGHPAQRQPAPTCGAAASKERRGPALHAPGQGPRAAAARSAPGDIGAVAKLKEVATGDVLVTGDAGGRASPPIAFPPPLMSFAVDGAQRWPTRTSSLASLRRMSDEDPTLDVHRDDQTGDLHRGGPLPDARRGHRRAHRAPLRRGDGPGARRTCPTGRPSPAAAEAEGKHKKQSGGRGQYGDCWVEVEPLPRGGGFEFVDKIVGGAIPRPFIPAVEKGVVEAMQAGELAGYPVVDVRVTLYDGKYHAVDSSEMAFKIAGSLGMKAALAKAGPVLLEPVMSVEVTVPVGARRRRHGRPQLAPRAPARHGGRAATTRSCAPRCRWPRCSSYAPDLRAMTGGRGDYTMEFDHYAQVPAHLAQKAAAAAAA